MPRGSTDIVEKMKYLVRLAAIDQLREIEEFVVSSLRIFFVILVIVTNEASVLIKVTNKVIIIIELAKSYNRLNSWKQNSGRSITL